jgi:hypothetical protein
MLTDAPATPVAKTLDGARGNAARSDVLPSELLLLRAKVALENDLCKQAIALQMSIARRCDVKSSGCFAAEISYLWCAVLKHSACQQSEQRLLDTH